jgi:hypothetical protein
MPLDLPWERPLHYKRGATTRLAGIDVYYDFDWLSIFPDNRAQFRNGQCLAEHIRDECPEGKTPALLLTASDDVKEGAVETESHYVLILDFPRYLKSAEGDAAVSYLANSVGAGITRLGELVELADASTEDQFRAFLDLRLRAADIAEWASGDAARLGQLREIAGTDAPEEPQGDVAAAIDALQELQALDPEILVAVANLIGPETDRDARLQLLRALTNDPVGRYDAGEVLGNRAADRVADTRQAAIDYRALIEDPGSTETDLQRFIEGHPWLLGLDYAAVRARRQIPRGIVDFILERLDGFHDLLELKSPQDPIITAPDGSEIPPSASDYALSPELAAALAQVHVYRDTLTTDAAAAERLYGLQHTRDPHVIIVIGRAESLPEHSRGVLRELNKSLHRVEIVPYDILADRADTVLDNVDRYLTAAAGISLEKPQSN